MTNGIKRQKEKDEMRALILKTANSIISNEGIEKLSIRKIAKQINYSPSIIYHYFNDKDEILNNLMRHGYQKIISAVSTSELHNFSPEERLIEMTKNYITAALTMSEEFMAVQLSKSKETLNITSSLYPGASKENPALSSLFNSLKSIYKNKEIDDNDIELTAQIIAVSALGLILKLIVEDIDEDQKKRLIDFYSEEIILRVVKNIKD